MLPEFLACIQKKYNSKGFRCRFGNYKLNLIKKVNSKELQSFSDYSIYDDYVLQGWPSITISRGEVIMENGVVYDNKLGHGKFIKRNTKLK